MARSRRFVLSNGHGSMLQYALLHLTGYALPLDELKHFRQLGSATPGHPSWGHPGVETTTGPLGQGLANAVGMALADGCLRSSSTVPTTRSSTTGPTCRRRRCMMGASRMACSLAGTLGLSKLVCFYDDNGISIDGKVAGWFTDDTPADSPRTDGTSSPMSTATTSTRSMRRYAPAHATTDRPTLICCKTIIGRGSPNRAGTDLAHGQALGEKEVALTREALGWSYPPFEVPQAAYDGWNARECGELLESDWNTRFAAYEAAYPALAAEFRRRLSGDLPTDFAAKAAAFAARQNEKAESIATRKASQQAIEAFAPLLPEMIGGAADLTGSVFTNWSGRSR
jgi:transketolase